ncbi:hypothetical protein [Fuscovulum ytuae]|jgi:hypothetical protein|uniref:Uncharacterized protein n=1 Tax=Fuscovulum ytuae TaxID=3042299 RepID=A0ABY8Q778_9RHOB|nr:hypothetical protein [Fuscovulum sp. YMD61]WGV16503.1 hypothetical protein QF092_01420 [Fuscovulum sp. YMD61]
MPKLIRLYIDSVLLGFALGIGFVLLLVILDVAQIGRLVLTGRDGLLAAGMMAVFFGGLFASVQFALRVVTIGAQDGSDKKR